MLPVFPHVRCQAPAQPISSISRRYFAVVLAGHQSGCSTRCMDDKPGAGIGTNRQNNLLLNDIFCLCAWCWYSLFLCNPSPTIQLPIDCWWRLWDANGYVINPFGVLEAFVLAMNALVLVLVCRLSLESPCQDSACTKPSVELCLSAAFAVVWALRWDWVTIRLISSSTSSTLGIKTETETF